MPSRVDAYNFISQLMLASGIVTMQRGYHFPEEASYPDSAYPLAAYAEEAAEQCNPQGNYAYLTEWDASVQLWVCTGETAPSGMGAGSGGWDMMDNLHDAILDSFARYFAGDGGPAPQTVVVVPTRFEPWYWYRSEKAPNVIASEMTLHVNVNMAFQSG